MTQYGQPFPAPDLNLIHLLDRALIHLGKLIRKSGRVVPMTAVAFVKAKFRGTKRMHDVLASFDMKGHAGNANRYKVSLAKIFVHLGIIQDEKEFDIDNPDFDFVVTPDPVWVSKHGYNRFFAKLEHLMRQNQHQRFSSNVDVNLKIPRNISPRDPIFNCIWAQFTVPLEAFLYENLANFGIFKGFIPGNGKRVIMKGLNSSQRAQAIVDKIDYFYECHGVEPDIWSNDATGWDAHQNRYLIRSENKFFMSVYVVFRYWFRAALRCFIRNKGFVDFIRLWPTAVDHQGTCTLP
jgi:hypothetical protein